MFTNNLLDIFITFPVTNCESDLGEENEIEFFSNVKLSENYNKWYKYSNKLFTLHTDI